MIELFAYCFKLYLITHIILSMLIYLFTTTWLYILFFSGSLAPGVIGVICELHNDCHYNNNNNLSTQQLMKLD